MLTWPLAAHLSTTLVDLGDAALTSWILDWVCHALTHDPLHLFQAPIFLPDKYPLAYSENLIGIAVVLLPFHLGGASAPALHNMATILGLASSAFAAYLLARFVTGGTLSAMIGGTFFGFTSFKFDHLAHVQIVWSAWLPLLLAALILYWRRPDARRAVFIGVAFLMNGLSNIYWLLMGGFAIAATTAFLSVIEPRRGRACWLRLFGALTIASLLLLPVLYPYSVVESLYRMRRFPGEIAAGSASLVDWLHASPLNRLYGWIDPAGARPERRLFPGVLVIALMGVAIALTPRREGSMRIAHAWRSRPGALRALDLTALLSIVAGTVMLMRTPIASAVGMAGPSRIPMMTASIPLTVGISALLVRLFLRYPGSRGGSLRTTIQASRFSWEAWTAALWGIIGFIASLGTNAFLVPFLFRVVHPYRAMRVPARWCVIAYVGLAIWAAIGASALLARTRRPRIVGALLLAFAVLEVVPHEIHWQRVPEPSPVYDWLARARPGIALELPMSGHGEQALYLLASTRHHQPIMNGASGWDGPTHDSLRRKYEAAALDDQFLDIVERAGCAVVIVHESLLDERRAAVESWLTREISRGRLRPLGRFESDAVYRTGRS